VGVTDVSETEAKIFSTSLYPNPAGDDVTAKFYLTKPSAVSFIVIDLTGKKLAEFAIEGQSGWNSNKLQLPVDLANGTYLLSLKAGVNNNFTRLIISR
jgi:hypothetical protein